MEEFSLRVEISCWRISACLTFAILAPTLLIVFIILIIMTKNWIFLIGCVLAPMMFILSWYIARGVKSTYIFELNGASDSFSMIRQPSCYGYCACVPFEQHNFALSDVDSFEICNYAVGVRESVHQFIVVLKNLTKYNSEASCPLDRLEDMGDYIGTFQRSIGNVHFQRYHDGRIWKKLDLLTEPHEDTRTFPTLDFRLDALNSSSSSSSSSSTCTPLPFFSPIFSSSSTSPSHPDSPSLSTSPVPSVCTSYSRSYQNKSRRSKEKDKQSGNGDDGGNTNNRNNSGGGVKDGGGGDSGAGGASTVYPDSDSTEDDYELDPGVRTSYAPISLSDIPAPKE